MTDRRRIGEFGAALVPADRRLDRPARVGLDAARAASAIYVVLYHLAQRLDLPRIIAVPFSFGQEAVIVFFLLSGFVIFANERTRVRQFGGYYVRRLRRIYPPILAAMLVSTLLWAVGLIHVRPGLVPAVSTLLSVQDISGLKPGVISDPYLHNDPLWSLSYEVFFYLVFPLVMVAWRRSERLTRAVIPVVCVLAYIGYLVMPNHLALVGAYFLLWWAGAMAAHVYARTGTGPVPGFLIDRLLIELAGLAALTVTAIAGVVVIGSRGVGFFPFLMVRHFAVALLLVVLALTPARRALVRVAAIAARPVVFTASLSYGLYVLHYPVLIQTGAGTSWWLLPVAVVTIGLAWLADVGLGRLLRRRAHPAAAAG